MFVPQIVSTITNQVYKWYKMNASYLMSIFIQFVTADLFVIVTLHNTTMCPTDVKVLG